jgi:hypothetical protein
MPDARGLTLPAISIMRDGAAYRTEEETMYPYTSRALAEERARDLQAEATRAHRARQLRLARRARRGQKVRVEIPDSYEDFLCRTAEAAMREPTAVGRASGQAIR